MLHWNLNVAYSLWSRLVVCYFSKCKRLSQTRGRMTSPAHSMQINVINISCSCCLLCRRWLQSNSNILEFDLNLLFSCVSRVRSCLLTDGMCVKMSLGSHFVPLIIILQLFCLATFDWTSFGLSGCFVLGCTHSNVHALSSAVRNVHICILVRLNSHWTDAWPHTGEPIPQHRKISIFVKLKKPSTEQRRRGTAPVDSY